MWRPPERIRHAPTFGPWPSAGQAARSLLFSPIAAGPLELEQRTWVPAMVPWRASEDGFVTDDVVDWYARFAAGRPGAIVVEATGVRDVPSGPLLRLSDDRYVPGLRRIVDAVARASGGRTRLFVQLIDFLQIRRRVSPETYLSRFLPITDDHRAALGLSAADDDEVRRRLLAASDESLARILTPRELEDMRQGFRERVTDRHLPHIDALPKLLPDRFALAAARAQAAGFDGVELHYAHAYTMASFLSPRNTRDDGYGGPIENRLQLPLAVVRSVRDAVGAGFAVGCRYLADECIPGGADPDDACRVGLELARAGLSFLSLSRGGKFEDASQPKLGAAAYPYTGPSGYECMPSFISDATGPFGRNAAAASRIRAFLRAHGETVPVVLAGGFHDFRQCERALRSGTADIIAMARQMLADPDWAVKVRAGEGRQVRGCEFTNYCEALDQKHDQVTCKLWDRRELSAGAPLSKDGRRRLVAPAWNEAKGDDAGPG